MIRFVEFLRRAIANALRRRREDKPWMRFAGVLQSGDPEASRTADEVVYARRRP